MTERQEPWRVFLVVATLVGCGGSSGMMGNGGGSASGQGGGSSSNGGGTASTGGGTAATGGSTGSVGGGSSTGGGTASPLALGASCQSGSACQSGFCADGVCCNSACTGTCEACSAAQSGGADGTCSPVPNGNVCRPAVGACDVAEVCTDGVCGANLVQNQGVVCRQAAGVCDIDEVCDGNGPDCPGDVLKSASTVCRTSTGDCDVAEMCTGSSSACPSDVLASAGTTCRPVAGVCDVAETCTGVSTVCPNDLKRGANEVCRPAAGPCDVAELCPGSSNDCPPVDVFLPSTSLACAPYRCTGMQAACATSCGTDSNCAPTNRAICTNGSCSTARLVFVTSGQFNADFGGIDAGDAICDAHARDAGLSGTFLAWLSTPSSSPSQRFTRDGGTYIRLGDKARVASDWADLTNGLQASIGYTEKATIPAMGTRHVFTGTTGAGNFSTVSGGNTNTNCSNWTNATSSFNVVWGQCDAISVGAPSWTSNGPSLCNSLNGGRLYCFEQ